jgi:hypothetical protein
MLSAFTILQTAVIKRSPEIGYAAWAGGLGSEGARLVAFSAGKVAQLFQSDGMAVRIKHADTRPFEGDQVHDVLMRRSCVWALIDDLANARSGGYDKPHSVTYRASRNRDLQSAGRPHRPAMPRFGGAFFSRAAEKRQAFPGRYSGSLGECEGLLNSRRQSDAFEPSAHRFG